MTPTEREQLWAMRRRLCAIHEAGHLVAGVRLGVPVRAAEVFQQRRPLGQVIYGAPAKVLPGWASSAISAAGEAAEFIFAPRELDAIVAVPDLMRELSEERLPPGDGAPILTDGDSIYTDGVAEAFKTRGVLATAEELAEHRMTALELAATLLVGTGPLVLALADELDRAGRIDGGDVLRIINDLRAGGEALAFLPDVAGLVVLPADAVPAAVAADPGPGPPTCPASLPDRTYGRRSIRVLPGGVPKVRDRGGHFPYKKSTAISGEVVVVAAPMLRGIPRRRPIDRESEACRVFRPADLHNLY